MKKLDWEKNILEFSKKFPAVSYGIFGSILLIIIGNCKWCSSNELLSFLALPFLPIALILAGISNVIPKYFFEIFNEVLPFILLLLILVFLDLIVALFNKLLTKYCGKNFFTKIILIAATLFLWSYVFMILIDFLPIDM